MFDGEKNIYQAAFEHSVTALFFVTVEGVITEVNSEGCKMFGYSPDEFKGLKFDQIFLNKSTDVRLFCNNRKPFESIGVLKDGSHIICECVCSECVDSDGQKLRLFQATNITEKRHAEERLTNITENIPGVVFRFKIAKDGSTQIMHISEGAEQVWGMSAEDVINDQKKVYKSYPDEDLKKHIKSILESKKNMTPWSHEWRYHHPDGTIRWHKGAGNPKKESDGSIVWEAIVTDITEERKEELRLSMLESVVTNTKDSVLITTAMPISDPDGPEIIYVNHAFTKMTGYLPEEVIGKTPRILQGPNTYGKELQKLRHAIKKQYQTDVELINYKKNDEEFWVHISLNPVFDDEGSCTHFIAIERDITERKNRELLKTLQSDVSRLFNEQESVSETLEAVLGSIVEFGNFNLAEIWLVNEDNTSMGLTGYKTLNESVQIFYEDSKRVQLFRKGQGMPGITWKTDKAQFWQNLGNNEKFLRSNSAKKSGIKSAYCIPIRYNNAVIGSLLLGLKEDLNKARYYISFLEELGEDLGAEIKRKQLEEQLNRIFNFSPDIICVSGMDGFFKKVNPAMCRLLGMTQDELLSHPISSFTHPDDRLRTEAELDAINRGKGSRNFENRYITKEGKVIWLSWTTRSFYDDGIIYSVAKDITEQKELELLLKQTNRLSKIGSWELDLVENSIYWSDITREIFDTGPAFVPTVENNIEFYKEGESREKMWDVSQRAIKNGLSWDIEVQIVTKSGDEKWVRSIGEAEIVDGKCVRLYGSLQDIHEKKSVEIRLRNISNNIPGVMFQYKIEPDGTDSLLYVSDGSNKLWDVSPEEAMIDSNKIWDRFHEDDYKEVKETIQQSADKLSRWQCNWRYHHPDGSLRWQEGYGTPRKMADGSVIWDSIVFDITEKRELENLLDQTTRLAKIGSWELNLRESDNEMYWSEMTRKILGVDESYNPTLTGGYEFYEPDSKDLIEDAVENAIKYGEDFDLELLIKTTKGNEKWIRCIGQSEMENHKCMRLFGSYQDIHQRKVAEIAHLTALEERDKILESIGDCFFAVNRDWTVTYWNQMAEQVIGKQRDTIIGQNLWEVFDPSPDHQFYKQGQRAMKQRCNVNFVEKDPELGRWFEISVYPSSSGLSIFFHDVTERIEAEEKIIEKSHQLDAIARFNGLLIKKDNWLEALEMCLDVFGEVINADRVYYFQNKRHNGSSEEDTTSMKIEWVREDIKAEIENPVHQNLPFNDVRYLIDQLSDRKIFNHVVSNIPDKDFKKLLENQSIKSILAVPVFTGGTFCGFIGFDDCTRERVWDEDEISFLQTISINLASAIENEDAETALQKAFEEKNEILESIGDAFFAVDHDWTVMYWNNVAEEILDMPRNRMIGKCLWDLYDDATSLEFYSQYHKAVNEQVTVHFEEYYPSAEKWFEVSAYPSHSGLSVYFKDISDRKESESQLKELNLSLKEHAQQLAVSNAELEQFAFVASHDLQEPLRMITSFLALLEKKYDEQLDENAKQYIGFATDGAKRMRQIILDLLDYSRIGRVTNEQSVVNINEVLEDIKILNRKLIEEKNAVVTWSTMPVIYAAQSSIQQLFQNLVNNALNYQDADNKPKVEILYEETDTHWKFYVKDNGIGINPEYKDKIFNIFQRLHGQEEYSGTGVGLAICKKIVEDNGGTIGVDSEEGQGSTFYFTIAKKSADSGK